MNSLDFLLLLIIACPDRCREQKKSENSPPFGGHKEEYCADYYEITR